MDRNRTLWTLTAALMALAVAAAGCGSDSPTAPSSAVTQATADDVALQVAQTMAAGNGGTMTELFAMAAAVPSGAAASGLGLRGAFGTAGAASETTFTVGNVTYTFTRAFYDADGVELAEYGPAAVRLRVTSRAAGGITGLQFAATLGHAGLTDVTGIAPSADTLGFDGAADDTVQTQFTSLDGLHTRHFSWLAHLAYADVRLLKARDVNPWPLSGTATWAVHAERLRAGARGDVEAVFDALVVVAFDGTQYPEVTVNGTYRYRVNLNTGQVARL
jgi:hypothetical protein